MGIHPHLREAVQAIDKWCASNGLPYDIACDESTLQGIKLFQNNQAVINNLLDAIAPLISKNHIYLETQKVRGGTILALSLASLSEDWMKNFLRQNGETMEPLTFAERVDKAFRSKVTPKPQTAPTTDLKQLEETAARIVNPQPQPKQAEQKHNFFTIDDLKSHKAKSKQPKPASFEQRVAKALGTAAPAIRNRFHQYLHETLQGMAAPPDQTAQPGMGGIATPDGQQPGDLFTKFSQALRVLGDQMNIGPLQDRLKEQGINWKKSDDNQSIILYIVNGTTNAPQPIARISAETLGKPADFEEQLTNMLDFAKGDAPGAFKQKQEELRNQEKAIRSISQAVSPKEPDAIAQQMQAGGGGGAVPQIQTAQPQAAQQAQQQPQQQPQQQQAAAAQPQRAAAQQAASPKPGM